MTVNIFAALLTGVLSMALGFLWYGPLFAKAWMKEVGLKEEDIKNGPGIGYMLAFLCATMIGLVASLVVHLTYTTNILNGALLGLALAFGFVATSFATNYIFAQRSAKLYLIDTGYQVVLVTIATVIATLLW
jgi:hypothetical protein